MIKIVDRYVFKELLDPFLFGLGAFTAILSSSMILFELVRAVALRGMSIAVALQIFVYRLPGIIVYIFPMATLLAALLAFSRLSHDSEIIAFRGSGVSLYRLIVPVLALGLLVSFTNLIFSEIVVPQSNKAAKNLLIEATTRSQPKMQKNVFVPEIERGALKRIYYAQTLAGGVMEGVIVQEFSPDGKLAQIISAERASWQKESETWRFENGVIYLIAESGEYKHLIKFKEQQVAIKYTPADFYTGDRNPDEMNMAQLKEFIKLKEKMGVDVTDFKIQFNIKAALPFASLVFAFLGAPLGLSPRRATTSVGLGISIIIIFIYYLTAFISLSLGELKVIPPSVSAWLPNLIAASIGWYNLNQAAVS